MSKLINLTGKKFGMLTVTSRADSRRKKKETKHGDRAYWLCKCECGNEKVIESYSLRTSSRSCGCGRKVSHFTHGQGGKHCSPEGKTDQAYIMYHNAKLRAKRKGLEFSIDLTDVVVPKTCPVLGLPLFRSDGGMQDNSPTLDRIRINQGYIKGNIMVISWRANRIKADAKIWEVEKILEYMRCHDYEYNRPIKEG